MTKKQCDYLIEANIVNGNDNNNNNNNNNDSVEWNECRRLGPIRQKTCEKCAFNHKNAELMAKAKRYYRIVK